MTKEMDCTMIVSAATVAAAGWHDPPRRSAEVEIRAAEPRCKSSRSSVAQTWPRRARSSRRRTVPLWGKHLWHRFIMNSETLARIPLFKSLDAEAIRRLDTQCAWRRAKAKEFILQYNDGGNDLYFVVQGHVRVLIQSISGKELILRDIRDGEYFGELAAIDGLPRSAAIVAITNSTIAKMPASVFRTAAYHHPDVCDQLLMLLTSQVRMLANRVNEYSTFDVRRRIYAELLLGWRARRATATTLRSSRRRPLTPNSRPGSAVIVRRSRASLTAWKQAG